MKYVEYQVWYHTYNTAIKSILRNSQPWTETVETCKISTDNIILQAVRIANTVVEKFSTVEDKPQTPNIDMQAFVNNFVNSSAKKK